MSLHHVGDEIGALRLLGGLLGPSGLLTVAEVADPMRILPDDLGPDLGGPGFTERLDAAESAWFASMRSGLSGTVPSADLEAMFRAAGLDVLGSRVARERFDPPLSEPARRVAVQRIDRSRTQLVELLDADDLQVLDVLNDPDDPRGILHRDDVFVAASRQIVIGRAQPVSS